MVSNHPLAVLEAWDTHVKVVVDFGARARGWPAGRPAAGGGAGGARG